MTIETFIIDLLKHNNCVVVPDFGGFIANYQPAVIDSVSQTITPPSKQVLFNAKLLKNDGLLANYIANQRQISYAESLAEINKKAKAWKIELANEKRLVFGEIGFLYEQDGTIVFEQNRETNLWLKAYGLSSIQFVSGKSIIEQEPEIKPVVKTPVAPIEKIKTRVEETPTIALSQTEKIEQDNEPVINKEEVDVVTLTTEKKPRRRWKYVAAACLIPALFYAYWIPMNTNFLETGHIQVSDFNPFTNNRPTAIYQQRENSLVIEKSEGFETLDKKIENLSDDVKLYHYQFDESTYIPVEIKSETPSSETVHKSEAKIEDHVVAHNAFDAKTAPIQLIAGCFSVQSNAQTLVSDLKTNGYPAYILDKHKGLYRVAVNGFQNTEAAKKAKSDLKAKSYPTWILKQ